jgi:hypothetical protein
MSIPGLSVPAPGHYCLLAKWTDQGRDTRLQFTDINAAILASPGGLIWHNINVVPGAGPSVAEIEWRKSALSNGQNLVVEIVGIERATGGHISIRLPGSVAGLLRDEPTLAGAVIMREEDYVLVKMALADGVYYFPLSDAGPAKINVPVEFTRGEMNLLRIDGHL